MEGDEPKARGFFRQALEIDPGYPRARTRLLLLDRRQEAAATAALEKRYHDELREIREGRAAGDEWPGASIDAALLEAGFGDSEAALRSVDEAIRLGYRDAGWLELDPMLARLRRHPGFAGRMARIRELVAAERRRVAGAPWLPPGLLGGGAQAGRGSR